MRVSFYPPQRPAAVSSTAAQGSLRGDPFAGPARAMSQRKKPAGRPAPDPGAAEDPIDEPAAKKPYNPEWWRGSRGRKEMLKAVRHRQAQQDRRWVSEIDRNPWAHLPAILEPQSPAHEFREHASKPELARYMLFLLQSVLMLIRCWKVSSDVEAYWGWGRRTTPRYALLFHHETELSEESYTLMTSMERVLFARVKKEGDNVIAMRQAVDKEWAHDRMMGVQRRLKAVLESTVVPAVLEGHLPKINFGSLVPVERQFDDCWKDRPI